MQDKPLSGTYPFGINQKSQNIKTKTEHCRPDQTPWAKYLLEIAAVAVGVAYTIAAYNQLGITSQTFALERPWLGPSGTVARTFGPTQPTQGQQINWTINPL